MKKNSMEFFVRKLVIMLMFLTVACCCLTGCDRTPPVVSGIDNVIELDCGEDFNLKNYLSENVEINDETDEGNVNYTLSQLKYTINCDKNVYDVETGEFNTEAYGEYDVKLAVEDENKNTTEYAFTVKLNPLQIKNTVEEIVEMDCGTLFNVKDYFAENIKITNLSDEKEYNLDDFNYTIDCDETVYNSASGKLDTDKFGEYKATLTVESESLEDKEVSFTIKLNPLVVEKGYYVYESEIASSGYEYLGFCEYKNMSAETLKVTSIEFKFYDKDGVMIGSSDMPEYSREYIANGESGYALDTYASYNSIINSSEEIADVEINIEIEKVSGEDTTSLEVDDTEIINNYDYNVSGFAGVNVVTNNYDKNVEYYTLLSGMYDDDGKLIGVMDSIDTSEIDAKSKARATTCWGPNSRDIPDKVSYLKSSAKVLKFEGE